eukprot:TRINITY_DN15520_c0_g1_i1.p1 TRINITY_DN15520_c0_g1~~TRINITY_DN15520_c0_g1_i1.p1  ORF type:complete len:330 (-),score=41.22 TRINITY_DN15520_c0_g1_i1:113-1102(-)
MSRRSRRLAGQSSGVEWATGVLQEPAVDLNLPRQTPSRAAAPEAAPRDEGWYRDSALLRGKRYLGLALMLRLVLIVYAEWQDANLMIKYTDIDYVVFTDAARYSAQGESPYLRSTYRYSPLLAWMLIPNVLVHPVWGKLLFAVLDLVAAVCMEHILRARGVSTMKATCYSWCWLFNPLAINMSTRGSCESVTAVLVLGALLACIRNRVTLAAVLHGAAVHFRIFPIFYAPAFLLYYGPRDASIFRAPFSWKGLHFGVCSAASFVILGVGCYAWYGEPFLQQTYLYHLIRQDTRHNFSIYFYYLYLQGNQGAAVDAVSYTHLTLPTKRIV